MFSFGRGPSLVEREALVRAFSPGSTLEPGLKAFRRRGPNCSLETPPLVSVGITNRDKRAASQRHLPAMIARAFSTGWNYQPRLKVYPFVSGW
jgi:hypothetical protein